MSNDEGFSDGLFEYVTEDSVSQSALEGKIKEIVIEEMEKSNIHPGTVEREVTTYTDDIRDLLSNVSTDEELEEIETMLNAIDSTVETQVEIDRNDNSDVPDAAKMAQHIQASQATPNQMAQHIQANATVEKDKNDK